MDAGKRGSSVLGVTSASLSQESMAVFLLLSFAVRLWEITALTLGQL